MTPRKQPADKPEPHPEKPAKGESGARSSRSKTPGPKPTEKPARERMTLPKVVAPEYENMPTEEIWEHYRKAKKATTKQPEDMERLRNVLMERHYPLVRYIAERLL